MSNLISETSIMGSGTVHFGRSFSDCESLAQAGIDHLGVGMIGAGYYCGRTTPGFSHLAACFEGEGEVFCDGSWTPFKKGMVVLHPKGLPHAARSIKGKTFSFFWTIFNADSKFCKNERFLKPLRVERDVSAIAAVIKELCGDAMGGRAASEAYEEACVAFIGSWLDEVLFRPGTKGRLEPLWREVSLRLEQKWSMRTLARKAGVSAPHLRRLCILETGLSPMRKLAKLRVEKAKSLLSSWDMKNVEIAKRTGYANMFAFSVAFKRVEGVSPSVWRLRARRGAKLQ